MALLHSLIDRFADTPLLVVGDVMADITLQGDVSRISPEAPVPVVDVREERFTPGGAGNVACNVASLGGRVSLVSVTGRDAAAEQLLDLLARRGVDVDAVQKDDGRPTIVKTRVIAGHQQVVRFDRESRRPLSGDVLSGVLDRVRGLLPRVKGVIVSDYGKGVVGERLLSALLPLARRRGVFVTVDPKIEHFLRYRGVDCITPNLKEAAEGMRALPPKTDAEVDRLGERILARLRSRSVLVTRGERGMSLYRAAHPPLHIPSRAREVFDVTGAGDTVISVLSLALAAGSALPDAARAANAAAGLVVAKLGTAAVAPAELKAALRAS